MTDRERLIVLLCNAHSKAIDEILSDDISYAQQLEIEADCLIANGVTFHKWVPVALGFLPENGGEYLCRCIVNNYDDMPFYMVLRYYAVDKHPHFQHEQTGGMKVTHWMPLPKLQRENNYGEEKCFPCEAASTGTGERSPKNGSTCGD